MLHSPGSVSHISLQDNNPNYFNYGFKKSFVDNPTKQQQVLQQLPSSKDLSPKKLRFKKRRKTSIMVQPEWHKQSHITDSLHNQNRHLNYKEFFDKQPGLPQPTDVLKYQIKSPSHGQSSFKTYENKDKHFWE